MTQPNHTPKPAFILDTGPLTVLCRFPLKGKPYIQTVVQYANLILPEGVIAEARGGTGVIARVAWPLLKTGIIQSIAAPSDPAILDTAYGKDLGKGERDVIKIALVAEWTLVMDDKDAFVVACRFGLRPVGFQDLMVKLVKTHNMPQPIAVEIVTETAHQYPKMFLPHTLDMLS